MKKTIILFILIGTFTILYPQERLTTRGILLPIEISVCMDLCSMFYLEADPGYEGTNVTWLPDPWLLTDYVGEHVEITGEGVWCVECGALNVQSIEIITDPPDLTVVAGFLFENTGDSFCMDGCDEFGIDPDEGFEFSWITTFGEVDILQPFTGHHVEFMGEEVTCVECSALTPGFINELTDDNLVGNGSFESGGNPALEGWEFACFAEPAPNAPLGSGVWSLNLESGNFQGCWPGIAVSFLSALTEPGDILVLSGRIKTIDEDIGAWIRLTSAGNPENVFGVGFSDTPEWTLITFTDTLLVNESTSLQVALDAGMTTGFMGSRAYFDQIVVQKTGQMQKGDVNGDTEINVLDIVQTVNIIILGGDGGSPYELWAADYNHDDNVDVLDVVQMVNVIVGIGD